MDSEQVTHIENVLQLFEIRVTQYDKTTEAILEELKPLLTEFGNICHATAEEITWTRLELHMPLLQLGCAIEYDDPDSVPEFMNILSPIDEDLSDADYCYRKMGFALPLVIAFKEPEEIRKFIRETIDKALIKKQGAEAPQLTVEQQTSAFLHRDISKGLKH
jgi:hypothetical protein